MGTPKLKILLESIKKNNSYTEPDGKRRFHFLGITKQNKGRVSASFWKTGTVAEIAEKISIYFDDLKIDTGKLSENYPKYQEYPSVKTLLRSLIKDGHLGKDDDKIPPPLSLNTLRSIFDNTMLPYTLLGMAVERIKYESSKKTSPVQTAYRIRIIKACLNRMLRYSQTKDHIMEEEIKENLNINSSDKAYNLGRLFAVLVQIQRLAENDTIAYKNYSGAVNYPVYTFPTLIERANTAWLKKINNSKDYAIYHNKMKEIIEKLGTENPYPVRLNLKEQGLFSVGYYQQIQYKSTK